MPASQVDQRAPADAPHGEGAALQRLQEAAPIRPQPEPPAPAPTPEVTPQLQQPYPAGPGATPARPIEQPSFTGDVSGGFDDQLFGPSNRPGEPVTAGAPFGPGANFTPQPGEDDRTFMLRVADQLDQSPTTDRVKMLAARIRSGQ